MFSSTDKSNERCAKQHFNNADPAISFGVAFSKRITVVYLVSVLSADGDTAVVLIEVDE